MTSFFQNKFLLKIFWGIFLVFIVVIPISQSGSIRVLLIIALLSVLTSGTKDLVRRLFSRSWDIWAYLFILSFGLIYSLDVQTGLKLIETSLSLLALPIIVGKLGGLNRSRVYNVLYALAGGLFIGSMICLIHASYLYSVNGDSRVFFFENLTRIIDSHPTYMAYYLIGVITFGLYLLYYEKMKVYSWVVILFLAFFFLMLMLTGGMASYVSMLFVLSFFILKYILDLKNRVQSLTFWCSHCNDHLYVWV